MFVFESYKLNNLELRNRVVMAPMCMYSSDNSGQVQDFHRVHYGTRAIGGTGLVIQEATAVMPQGRISSNDLGIWSDHHVEGLRSVVKLIHSGGAAAGIQLAHAGRKCEVEGESTAAPSAVSFSEDYPTPHELTIEQIKDTVEAFGQAAVRAAQAGYDLIEIHAAHGYLIHEFLSPLSNHRTDHYGGSLENRVRFLQEVIVAIRRSWPADHPLIIRLSASDYLEGGLDIDQTIHIVNMTKGNIDAFHISSGGLLPAPIKAYPGYQVGFAEKINQTCDVPVIAVGLISSIEQAEEILGNQRAQLVAMGRELLRNPYWPVRHCLPDKTPGCPVPEPYKNGWRSCPPQ